MKKEEFVKLGLDEEIAKKCEAASAEELKTFIPKVRFDEVNNEKKNLETAKNTLEGQLEALKNSTGDVEGMKKQIETLQAENKAKEEIHMAEIKQLKIDSALDSAISGAKGKNAKAIKSLLDMSKVDVDKNGNVVGHAEQLEALTKADDSKFLFDTQTNKTKLKGVAPGESGNDGTTGSVDTSKMSYEEMAAYLTQNPDAEI